MDIGIFPSPFRENPLQTSRFCRDHADSQHLSKRNELRAGPQRGPLPH